MTSLRDLVVRLLTDSSGLIKGFDDAGNKVGGFEGRLNKAAGTARSAGLAMTGSVSAPLLAIGMDAVKTAADFEQGMNLLQAVTHASGDQMKQLSDKAIALGADLTLPKTSATDAGEAMLELSKAGLSVNDTLTAAKGVLQLSSAANIDNAKAAEIAANALNAFNLPGEKAATVANLLANASNASSVEITDVADSLKMAGAVFSAFQGPVIGSEKALEDLTTSIAIMGNAGIKGSDAGTSLKQAMLQLTGPSQVAKGMMDAVFMAAQGGAVGMDHLSEAIEGATKKARETGMKEYTADLKAAGIATEGLGSLAYNADGSMRSFNDIIKLTAAGTKNMTDEERNHALTQIFGADATRAAIVLMKAQNENLETGTTAFQDMSKAVDQEGGAADLANARMKGLNGAIQGLQSAWETFLLTAGTPLLEHFTQLVQAASGVMTWFMNLPEPVRNTGMAFGAVLIVAGPLVLMLGALVTAAGALALPILGVVAALAALAAAVAFVQSGGLDAVGDWFDHAPGPIRAVGQEIKAVAGFFGNLKDAVGGAFEALGKLAGVKLPGGIHIPGFAGGVQNFAGGLAIVGERGPELVSLPSGSSVYPLGGGSSSFAAAGGAGGMQVVFTGPVYGFNDFEDRVVEALDRADRRGRR